MNKFVVYSDGVGCPGEVISSDMVIETGLDMQPVEEAENEKDFPYAHYYEELECDYGMTEYHYLETTNA